MNDNTTTQTRGHRGFLATVALAITVALGVGLMTTTSASAERHPPNGSRGAAADGGRAGRRSQRQWSAVRNVEVARSIAVWAAWVGRSALSIMKSWMMPPKRTAVVGTPAARSLAA